MISTSCRSYTGHFARFMQRRGWAGVTLPTPWAIYVLYWGEPTLDTVRHEWIHVQQAWRYGVLGFWARYAWLWLRHGYAAHPMELEARRAE